MSFRPKTALIAIILLSSILASGCSSVKNLVEAADNWVKTNVW